MLNRVLISAAALVVFLALLRGVCDAAAGDLSAVMERADSLAATRDYDAAAALLEPVAKDAAVRASLRVILLRRLAGYRYRQAHYGEAVTWYRQALSLAADAHVDDTTLANLHNDLAINLFFSGEYDSAGVEFETAADMRRAALGNEHPDVAASLNGLATVEVYLGRYLAADSLFHLALSIRETALGPDHPDVAKVLNGLGNLYWDLGRFDDAELVQERALTIMRAANGDDSPQTLANRTGLANVYLAQARYAEAEPLYRKILAIAETSAGPDHPQVARAAYNLALLYWKEGRPEDAEPLYRRAAEITRASLGDGHISLATFLRGMAQVREATGDLATAESLYVEALRIAGGALGDSSLDVAGLLNSLGDVRVKGGRYAEADSAYSDAAAIAIAAAGEDHPLVATSLDGLAWVAMETDRLDSAATLLDRAYAIETHVYGPRHPQLAGILQSRVRLLRLQEDRYGAAKTALQAYDFLAENFRLNASAMTEENALRFSAELRRTGNLFLSCVSDLPPDERGNVSGLGDFILSAKGSISDEIFRRHQTVSREDDPILRRNVDALRDTKYFLSELYVDGPGDNPEEYRLQLDSLSATADSLESALSRLGARYRIGRQYEDASVSSVEKSLPRASSLVEFLSFEYFGTETAALRAKQYLALIVHPDDRPRVVWLGNGSEIDSSVAIYSRHVLRVAEFGGATDDDQREYAAISRQLYSRVWEPLVPFIKDSWMVLISPDGDLNVVSFAGLLDNDGRYLVETQLLHYLSSGRDLLRLAKSRADGAGLLAMGDPDFDATPAMRLDPSVVVSHGPPATGHFTADLRTACGGLTDMVVGALPGTQREVNEVAHFWRNSRSEEAMVRTGSQASEERFKSDAPGRRAIHLATHGYFLGDACPKPNDVSVRGTEQSWVGEHPLLLTGLLLAGANRHGDDTGTDDGILTAYEVSAMNLKGTRPSSSPHVRRGWELSPTGKGCTVCAALFRWRGYARW